MFFFLNIKYYSDHKLIYLVFRNEYYKIIFAIYIYEYFNCDIIQTILQNIIYILRKKIIFFGIKGIKREIV